MKSVVDIILYIAGFALVALIALYVLIEKGVIATSATATWGGLVGNMALGVVFVGFVALFLEIFNIFKS